MQPDGFMDKNSNAHLDQWKHNRSFLRSIPGEYPDWIVTVAFYTALHVIDALLAKEARTITDHKTRNEVLRKTNRYEKIWRAYQPLYGLSRTVRYLADPTQWVPIDKIKPNVFNDYLYRIEESVFKLLGKDENPEPITIKDMREPSTKATTASP